MVVKRIITNGSGPNYIYLSGVESNDKEAAAERCKNSCDGMLKRKSMLCSATLYKYNAAWIEACKAGRISFCSLE